jgi:hypothetical protein
MRIHRCVPGVLFWSGLFVALLASADPPPIPRARAPLAARLGTPGETLVLSGRLTGHARFRASHLINRGNLLLCDGPSQIEGALTNQGSIEVREARVDVRGPVTNLGILRVTDAEVHFEAPYAEHGGYLSDPSDNYFTDLIIGTSGYLVGGEGDRFFVSGDLVSASTSNTSWSTEAAALIFHTGVDTLHSLSLTGSDFGPLEIGYTQNFAWGRLEIVPGNSLTLVDGNATPNGALYAGEVVGAQLAGNTVSNITAAAGLAIYYDPALAANAYLAGATYDLTTGGSLVPLGPPPPVPTLGPFSRLVLILGLMGLALPPALRRLGVGAASRPMQRAGHARAEHTRREPPCQ